jgi:uncharacterized protein YciI
MFIILVSYVKPLDEIDRLLPDHRTFLEEAYQAGYFVLSGPQVPRTGGVILARAANRAVIEQLLQHDPLHIAGAATYNVIEVEPTQLAPELGLLQSAPR